MSELVALGLLGIGVALGLFVSRKARVLGIPALMAFGLLIGANGLGVLEEGPALDGAVHVGLVLMLFFTSLFGNPRAIRDGGRVGLPLAAYDLVLNFGVAWWIGALMGFTTEDRLFLAGIIATSSTAVVMKLLGDEGRITRREGNVLVSMLMVEDWVFLAFYAFLGIRYGGTLDVSATGLAISLPLFAGFLLLVRAIRPWIWSLGQREVLIALLTAVGLVGAFLGGRAGLPEVGSAFTTGLVLSGPQGGRLQREAPYLREIAAGIFFIGFGAQLGPGMSLALLPLLGLCLAGVVVVEMLFIPVLARRLGLRRSEAFLVGSSLVARGGKSAAFAKLYPHREGAAPLFPIAGLLAVVLTPLAPLLVKFALLFARPHARHNYADPGESFSRGARGLLLPHAFQQRTSLGVWDRVVFWQWLTLTMSLAGLGIMAPPPWRFGAIILAAGCLPMMYRSLWSLVQTSPGAPRLVHPRPAQGGSSSAHKHLPIMLSAPLALLLAFGGLSAWATVTYPVILIGLLVTVIVLPWLRPLKRRAPGSRYVRAKGRATFATTPKRSRGVHMGRRPSIAPGWTSPAPVARRAPAPASNPFGAMLARASPAILDRA